MKMWSHERPKAHLKEMVLFFFIICGSFCKTDALRFCSAQFCAADINSDTGLIAVFRWKGLSLQ